jgi:hypothetical protein
VLQVAAIAPAYAPYRQLIIDNNLTGEFIANKSDSALASALADIGIGKELHASCVMKVLMQLKSGDESALTAATSHPSN